MRSILDTNLLVSSLIFQQSTAAEAVAKVFEVSEIVTSDDTLMELKYVLQKPKLHRYVAPEKAMVFYLSYKRITTNISILTKVKACRDPKDDMFLELAVNSQANYIITGDQDLLVLHPFRQTQILTASQFLDKIAM